VPRSRPACWLVDDTSFGGFAGPRVLRFLADVLK
jgi:hypothetical protein